ncbi:MAG TPA: GFA family protein [Aurantimonas sp.]|uniref:GFA family protein n=1 Tax=Aurantimonas marianensis TaxID=2920428 RepID=A0A9X2H5P0_9HYPH|nr:GFA family protein [Aurantimonas marianensis]MCP3054290.1 GFA family protein [Aurantimonas marianensis]
MPDIRPPDADRGKHRLSVRLPALPLTGGCQCGQVRYEIRKVPFAFYLCHCTECQRHTSSAYGESLRVESASVVITGTLRTTRRSSESGTVRLGDFCPECGVRIQHRSEGNPDRLNIKAGTLDDTSWLAPAGHIWVRSKQPFVAIGPDELAYDRQPEDGSQRIVARWREMLAAGERC